MKIINGVRIMNKFNILAFTICLFLTGNVYSAQYEVKMLSSHNGQMMVFEPPVINIQPGDTVRWLNANPGHNTASIDSMIPSNAKGWNGKMNEEIVVKFTEQGVYGYKCTPHYILGMVGLVIVGSSDSNFEKVKVLAEEEQSKFATNKNRFSEYFSLVK